MAILAVAAGLLMLSIGGCARSGVVGITSAKSIDFETLVSRPQAYAGRRICTEGIYASGFEISAMGSSTYQRGEAIYLAEPTIWIEGGETYHPILSSGECFTSTTVMPVEFCPATACGVFEFGEGYGHTGGWAYQIAAK
jgi:hypothetical protein